jgi:hypothetical protein
MQEFEEYKFPDEQPQEETPDIEIEIEDDTPLEDRGRKPSQPEFVEKLEKDELEEYSDDARKKINEYKKVWHDERRAKEAALREQQEAIAIAQKLLEENKKMKGMLHSGEEEYKEAVKESAKNAVKAAKKAFKEAYEIGDADKMLEAQEDIVKAQLELDRIKKFKLPPLQEENNEVKLPQEQPLPDRRAMAWQERNPWFGQDEEMTATALGLHEKLRRNGVMVGSDDYYAKLDETIRRRFPEHFGVKSEQREPEKKPATVVAPAVRSTSSKKVTLTKSQEALAKKLGLTLEQYAIELKKVGN